MSQNLASKEGKNLTVYFDGLCHLCSREIDHYRTMEGATAIDFVDITDPSFDAKIFGLDPLLVHKNLHTQSRSGETHVGVDAFISIWNELPQLRWLARIAKTPIAHKTLSLFYLGFTKIRPMLPRKSCESSPYCKTQHSTCVNNGSRSEPLLLRIL